MSSEFHIDLVKDADTFWKEIPPRKLLRMTKKQVSALALEKIISYEDADACIDVLDNIQEHLKRQAPLPDVTGFDVENYIEEQVRSRE